MKKKLYAAGALLLVVGGGGLVAYRRADATDAPAYRFATIDRGDIESTVSATGTLSADTTVQVGTQVSGVVTNIYVDFNDHVRKGQLIARIDPTLAHQAVSDAEAGVARAQATLDQTRGDYEREKALFTQKVVTASEFATTRSAYEVAKANLTSAQVALDKARQNLAYTNIYAPIDGIVVERNVNVGQTVAASFSAPQLFLIANNLSNMQILASVDESDIGLIKQGQPVRFTVQAYPSRTFLGKVKQVRLQSATQDNVVNYTVVVSVRNEDGALLPGMTATVNFLTGSAKHVLTVPNAALRFRPPVTAEGEQRQAGARRGPGGPQRPGDGGGQRFAGRGPGGRSGSFQRRDSSFGLVWYLKNGQLARAHVHTGISDGQRTEIQSSDLQPGTQVIVGLALGDAPSESGPASPFQQQRRGFGPRF